MGVTAGRATGYEGWLRLACLAVSVVLHVGLGIAGWQSLWSRSADDGPMIVALVERPEASPHVAASAPAAPRTALPAAASRAARSSSMPSAMPRVVPVVAAQPLCAVPAETVVEAATETGTTTRDAGADASSGAGAAIDISGADGGGNGGDGSAAPGGGNEGSGTSGGTLVRATPRYESNPLPPYPRLARVNRWEGTVRLRARVTVGGKVEAVSLERSSGHEVLDRAALKGVQLWRFVPASRGGVPVACEVSIPVAFRLTD